MRVAVAQIDPVVGDFEGNLRKIQSVYERACTEQARLLLTPELSLCGYPPLDLIYRPEFFPRTEAALEKVKAMTRGKKTAIIVGHVGRNEAPTGRPATNRVSVIEDGKILQSQDKTLLPTYDVFDEARYFEPATECKPLMLDGLKVGIGICEDLWADDLVFGRRLYERAPVEQYLRQGLDLLVSISASPYDFAKREKREKVHSVLAKKLGVPLVYVNQACANDDLLFDGGSFALSKEGEVFGRLPFFRTGFMVVDMKTLKAEGRETVTDCPSEIEMLADGLVMGIRDYFNRSGFKKTVLGLSGGIDSAVVAALAARALGPENVCGVAMPSQNSSSHSIADAEALARKLGIRFELHPIKFLFSNASRELSEKRNPLASLAVENLQSRLRGLVLMTVSNHDDALVLATGNKSELAVGYCTLYGDLIGALAPIGDLLKTQVYDLARYMNQAWGGVIPESTLTKPPSAELRPGQTDQDSLPPYDLLDRVITSYIEENRSVEEMRTVLGDELEARRPPGLKAGANVLDSLLRQIDRAEYKRRQGPPILRISRKALGSGRRVPINLKTPV